MRAISVRQPWAWAIVYGGKDVENRGRREPWHGAIGERVLIHAAKTPEPGDEGNVWALAGLPNPPGRYDSLLPHEAAVLGALIGTATVTGVHHYRQCHGACSKWAQPDQWHITLTDPAPLIDPVPWRGALGLFEVETWEPDPDLVEAQESHAALMGTLCPCGHPYSVHDKQRSDGGPPFCNFTLSRRCGCNGLGLEAS